MIASRHLLRHKDPQHRTLGVFQRQLRWHNARALGILKGDVYTDVDQTQSEGDKLKCVFFDSRLSGGRLVGYKSTTEEKFLQQDGTGTDYLLCDGKDFIV